MNRIRNIFFSVYSALMLSAFATVSFASYKGIQPGFGLSQPASEALVYWTGMLCFIASAVLFAWAFILSLIWAFTPKPIRD